jgi:2-octaprenyl-6-methoxyphenol hydroxylase
MSVQDVDVVVAGAGLAGATLAVALAQAGLRVAAVDAQAPGEGGGDGRASAISFAPFRVWRALGIAGRLSAVQPIAGIVVTDGRAGSPAPRLPSPAWIGFDAGDLGTADAGEPLGFMVENRDARAALGTALAEAGVTLIAPDRVETATPGPASIAVRLGSGRTLRAALVAAADGRDSRLRLAAGVGVTGWPYEQAALVATVAHDTPHEGIARQIFLPSGPLAVLPLPGNRSSLVWTETPERAATLKRLPAAAFEALLLRRLGAGLGAVRLEGERWTHPLAVQLAERHTADRLALVGDAACSIHPLAGQGLNLGIKDAAALAEVVADAFRIGEDVGAPAVLDRYARRRRFDAAALAAGTDALRRLYAESDPVIAGARSVGIAIANRVGPLRRLFAREAGGATGDPPRLVRERQGAFSKPRPARGGAPAPS